MDSKTITVTIFGRDRVSPALTSAGSSMGKFHARTVAVGAAVGFALERAGEAAISFAKDSVRAFADAQTEQLKLQDAYRRFPRLASVSIGSLRELNDAIQAKTGADHNALAAGEATLAQFKLTGTQIQQLIPLVNDYATKTGRDVPSAAGLLGRAFLGNARALKEVGIQFKATGKTGKDFQTIFGALRDKVGGFANREGRTAAGQAKILSAQFRDLEEQVGRALLPKLLELAKFLNTRVVPAVKSLAAWGEANKGWIKPVAEGLAGIAASVKIINLGRGALGSVSGALGRGAAGGLAGTVATRAEPIPVYVTNWKGGGGGPGGVGGGAVSTAAHDAEAVGAGAGATWISRVKVGFKNSLRRGMLSLGVDLFGNLAGNALNASGHRRLGYETKNAASIFGSTFAFGPEFAAPALAAFGIGSALHTFGNGGLGAGLTGASRHAWMNTAPTTAAQAADTQTWLAAHPQTFARFRQRLPDLTTTQITQYVAALRAAGVDVEHFRGKLKGIATSLDDSVGATKRAIAAGAGYRQNLNALARTDFAKTLRAHVFPALNALPQWFGQAASKLPGKGEQAAAGYGDGVVQGLNAKAGSVAAAAANLGDLIDKAFRGRKGIFAFSPSRKGMKSGSDYVAGVVAGAKAGDKTVRLGQELADGLINGWQGRSQKVYNAMSGTTRHALDRLGSVLSNAGQFRSGVVGGISSYGAVSGAQGSGVGPRAYTRAKLNDIRKFVNVMKKLKREGLNRSDLSDLWQQGPSALGEAEALAQLSLAGIRGENRDRRQIDALSRAGGRIAGQQVYGAAVERALMSLPRDIERALAKEGAIRIYIDGQEVHGHRVHRQRRAG